MGIVIIVLTYIFKEEHRLISPIMQTFGQILISVSATAILFEHFGYVDYAVKRLCEAFTHDEVIKSLNNEKKKEFKSKLEKDLYLRDCEDEESIELLNLINSDTNKILSDYFYSEYITYVDFFIDDKKFIKKRIRRTFTAKPIVKGNKCTIANLLYLRTHTLLEDNNNLTIELLKINDKELKKDEDYDIDSILKEKEGDSYNVEYLIKIKKKKLLEFTDSLDVDITYETIVNYSDKIYAITIDKPCAHFCCHFNIDTSKYDINLKSYGFMCFGQENKDRKREIQTFNGTMLRFLTWILPGDGVVAIVSEKGT